MVTALMEHIHELLKDLHFTFRKARSPDDSSLRRWGGYPATLLSDSSNWSS